MQFRSFDSLCKWILLWELAKSNCKVHWKWIEAVLFGMCDCSLGALFCNAFSSTDYFCDTMTRTSHRIPSVQGHYGIGCLIFCPFPNNPTHRDCLFTTVIKWVNIFRNLPIPIPKSCFLSKTLIPRPHSLSKSLPTQYDSKFVVAMSSRLPFYTDFKMLWSPNLPRPALAGSVPCNIFKLLKKVTGNLWQLQVYHHI